MPTDRSTGRRHLLPAFALAAGVLGVAALWLAATRVVGGSTGWMALVAAVDLALMLRLAAMPPGRARALAAVAGTVLAIALAYWMLAAAEMGRWLGLQPWESATRLGPVLAWELVRHGHGLWDAALALASLPLAWWLAR